MAADDRACWRRARRCLYSLLDQPITGRDAEHVAVGSSSTTQPNSPKERAVRWLRPTSLPTSASTSLVEKSKWIPPCRVGSATRWKTQTRDLFHGPRSGIRPAPPGRPAAQCSRPPLASRAGSVQSNVTISAVRGPWASPKRRHEECVKGCGVGHHVGRPINSRAGMHRQLGRPTSTVGMPVRAGCHRSDRRPAGQVGAVLVALQRHTCLAASQFEGGGRPAVGGVPQVGLHLQHRTAVDGDPVRRFMPPRVVRVSGVRHVPGHLWKWSTGVGKSSRSPLAANTIRSNVVSRRSDWRRGRRSSRPPRDRTAPAPGETHPAPRQGTPRGPRNRCPGYRAAER